MITNIYVLALTACLALTAAACSSHKESTAATVANGQLEKGAVIPMIDQPAEPNPDRSDYIASAVPMAIIYRTNGDFADNVPITLTADHKGVANYPAPTDLDAAQKPALLTNGYWLDRRGINAYTAFTRYTYSEYMQLPAPPTIKQLLASVIPGAEVTEIVRLPIPAYQAANDPAICDSMIANGLKGATVVLQRRAITINPEAL